MSWKFSGDILRICQVIANIREGAEYAPPARRGLSLGILIS